MQYCSGSCSAALAGGLNFSPDRTRQCNSLMPADRAHLLKAVQALDASKSKASFAEGKALMQDFGKAAKKSAAEQGERVRDS